jgi:hypothetical protein
MVITLVIIVSNQKTVGHIIRDNIHPNSSPSFSVLTYYVNTMTSGVETE